MKSYKRNMLFFFLSVVFMLTINSAIFYYTACVGNIVQSTDCYGQTYESDKLVNAEINKLIEKYGNDCESMNRELSEEISELNSVYYGLREVQDYGETLSEVLNNTYLQTTNKETLVLLEEYFGNKDINIAQTTESLNSKTTMYRAAINTTDKYLDYDGFLESVSVNADYMLNISIYKNDMYSISNIEKTKTDFARLQGLAPGYADDSGFGSFINYRITDIIVILSVMLLTPLFGVMIKSADSTLTFDKRVVVIIPTVFALAVLVMYGMNLLLSIIFIGGVDASLPIQSYPILYYSGERISTGLFLLFFFLSKLAGALILLLLASSVLTVIRAGKSAVNKICGIALALFIIAELVFSIVMSDGSILKEINIFSCFLPERFFIRYINVDIFGNAVSRTALFIGFSVVILGLAAIIFVRNLLNFMKRARAEAEQSYYNEINRKYEQSRAIRHDINNHLTVISMLIEKGDTKGAMKYINEVFDETSLAMQPLKTGSDVLDALLYKKTELAKKSDITLSYEVNASLDVGISNYDMCVIFGNILDNAIEASAKSEGEREITLTVGTQHEMLYISCHNSHSGEIKEQGDKLVTTKADSTMHGIGLSRIKTVAEKYGGTVKVSYDKTSFLIEVLIHKIK
ncbi:MAG: GHKL domain-containing protein [Ruminiclostridium sp.]|nr:GHKL domain-containing protein [Ruminiclostridium sp.]